MSKNKSSQYQNTKDDIKNQLRRLTAENRRLSRENDALKNEIDSLQGKQSKRNVLNKYQYALKHRSEAECMYSKKNFASFLFTQLKFTSFFHIYTQVINIFRRYSFITTSLKVFSLIFLFFEASLLVVLSTSAFVASLIFTLFLSHLFTVLTIFARKKYNKINKEALTEKNITIFFPPKERAFDHDSFFNKFVKDEANGINSHIIIVSPYVFKSIGLDHSKKLYFCYRNDGENIILVRRGYYFSLRKNVINKVAKSVKEIY